MAIVDLSLKATSAIDTGLDNVVIVDNFKSKRGGVSLDVTGYPKAVIRAGHLILKNTTTGEKVPMPLNTAGNGYADAIPADHTVYGIAINSVETSKAMIGVMFSGTVNPKVIKPADGYFDINPLLEEVKEGLIAEGHFITFKGDND